MLPFNRWLAFALCLFVRQCVYMAIYVYLCMTVSYPALMCMCTTFLFTREPEQVQLWEHQMHTWHAAAIIKKPIDDSDPSLWEMERGEGRREAVDEMFLLCFTGSDTDPSVNKSFTRAYRLCSDTGLFPHFPPTVCPPPLQLHCTLMFTEPLQGCDVQVRSRPPTSCRAEVDSGYIFLCLMFCFLSFKPVLWNINNVTT